MSGKVILVLTLTFVLIGTLCLTLKVQRVEANGTIAITADGSVDPSSAPIERDGNVYTFSDDIYDNSIVVGRDNITIDGDGHLLKGSGYGITLFGRRYVTIKNIQIESFEYGDICLRHSSYNTITGNNLKNNGYGVWVDMSSNNNIISRNIVVNNTYGFRLSNSSNNLISGNNIKNNSAGFRLESFSNNNIISGNIVVNNTYGFSLSNSSNNRIYHNNLLNNTNQVYTYNSVNFWDDGYPSVGNYWSIYTGVDADMDGIGDSFYEIDLMNIDHYPLMGLFSDFPVALEQETHHVTTVCNSTISAFEFDEVNRIIRFNVTGEEDIGFCRVCIPHNLMEPPYLVTVDKYPPLYVNYTLYDNGTHRWICFTYQHSTHEVEIIPEFPTWASILLILVVLTVAIAVYNRRLRKTPIHNQIFTFL